MDREAWHAAIHRVAKSRHDWVTELNWTERVGPVWLFQSYEVSLPGSSVCGIFQARILKWVAISFSRESLDPGTELASPSMAGRFFNTESPGKLYFRYLSLIGSFSHAQILETFFRYFCYHKNPTTCLKKFSVEKYRILLAIRIANIESYFKHQFMLLLKISFLTEISISFFLFGLVSVL